MLVLQPGAALQLTGLYSQQIAVSNESDSERDRAGTDDGRVHVTRDGGQMWESVEDRIRGVPDNTWVPHIEPSKFDPAVAYVVFEEGEAASVRDLRSVLEKQLPLYMVPAHFVALEELPLTSNGKLEQLDSNRPPLGVNFDNPITESQSTLTLMPGDRLLLASDGLTEAMNATGEYLGIHGVEPIICDRSATSETVVARLHEVLIEHCGGPSTTDDVTLLCVDRL